MQCENSLIVIKRILVYLLQILKKLVLQNKKIEKYIEVIKI